MKQFSNSIILYLRTQKLALFQYIFTMRDTSLYITFQAGTKGHRVNRGKQRVLTEENSPSSLLMGRLASLGDG
jgi:hypothetical protein